jgi:hypothetical protein
MLEFDEDTGYIDTDDEELFKEIEENINIEEEVGYEEIPDEEMEKSAYLAFIQDQDQQEET